VSFTPAQQRRAFYDRYHKSTSASGVRKQDPRVTVPEDVQRIIGDGSPCFMCESRDPCRHRPWMLAS
jgi:hypothetical protein